MPQSLSSLRFGVSSFSGGYARTMPSHRRTASAARPAYPFDKAWIEFVKQWIEREGHGSQTKLARAAEISAGTLSQMLSGAYHSSVAVPAINKMVGLPPPHLASGSADESDLGAQVNATIASLDGEDAELLREMIENAVKQGRRMAQRSAKKT